MILKTSVRPLIVENKQRSEVYKTVAERTSDKGLKQLFNRFSMQSRNFAREVNRFPKSTSSAPPGTTTNWHQISTSVNDRNTLLSCCENCENAILKQYDDTLIETEDMPSVFQEIIIRQRNALQRACDEIRSLRNT
jgi:uncharacterized protein (TIGR02284 family)